MRLHILSDLHLEFAPFEPAEVKADVVILAGDVHPGDLGLEWILENYPETPVLFVLGNHEFYGHDLLKLTLELKERCQGTNIHILENDRIEIGDVTFLGATLWTDFALLGDEAAAQAEAAFQMTDYRRIHLGSADSKFHPRDSRKMHLESVSWLAEQVRLNAGKKTVIVTHHAPSLRSIKPKNQNRPLNPAYASNLETLVESSGAILWVHGHIHHCSDYVIGATRVIANTRGYPEEEVSGFNPALVVEI
jgi:Icc-related predicted phosphoesterase